MAYSGTKAMRGTTEFLRRADALQQYQQSGGVGAAGEAAAAGEGLAAPSLVNPAQAYVVYNLAHANTCIRTSDGQARVRLLGFFPSKTAAQAHANRVISEDPGLETRMMPAAHFFGVSRNKYKDVYADEVVTDPQTGARAVRKVLVHFDRDGRVAECTKVERLLKRHAKLRRAQQMEVKMNALKRRMGETAVSMHQKLLEDVDADELKRRAEEEAVARRLEDEEAAAALRMSLTSALAPLLPPAPVATAPTPDTPAPAAQQPQQPRHQPEEDEDTKVEDDEEPLASHASHTSHSSHTMHGTATLGGGDGGVGSGTKHASTTAVAASGASSASTVKAIPQTLEVRFQKFAVMAIVDDYMTLREHERVVDAWCAARDAQYQAEREELLWSVLELNGRLRQLDGAAAAFLAADAADKAFEAEYGADRAQDEREAARTAATEAACRGGASELQARQAGNLAASAVARRTTATTARACRAAGLSLADVLPPLHRLIRKWLDNNQPPAGYNVWGEYIGAEACAGASGLGWLKSKRADVVAAKAAFDPVYDAAADPALVPPPNGERALKVWVQMRDMRLEEQTWKWTGHTHVPLRTEIIRAWLAAHPPPALEALAQEEPAVAVYQAFESEEDAQRWLKRIEKAQDVRDYDLHVVAMYEWVRLADRHDENVPRHYRNQHVHDIMASKQEQAARVRELELEARVTKRKMRVVTVANNAVTAGEELPAGLSEGEWAAVTEATRKAEAEADAELRAMQAAEAQGREYAPKKLRAQRIALEERVVGGEPPSLPPGGAGTGAGAGAGTAVGAGAFDVFDIDLAQYK